MPIAIPTAASCTPIPTFTATRAMNTSTNKSREKLGGTAANNSGRLTCFEVGGVW
jgi:hypothetical protein